MKIIKPIKSTWFDWLINHITEPTRNIAEGFKDKVVTLFNTNPPKQTVYGRGKKLSKPKTQNKTKKKEEDKCIDRIEGIIRNIWTLHEAEKRKEKRNKKIRETKKKLMIH